MPFHLPHLSLPASHIKILKHSGSSASPPSLRLRPLLYSRERKHSGGHGKPSTELCHPSTHLLPLCAFGLRFSTQKNETQPGSHGNRASSSTPWPPGFRSVFSRWLTAAVTQKKTHKGCKPPGSFTQPPRSAYQALHRCIHRHYHIDRLTRIATVPHTPPTRHLGGGTCDPRAASKGLWTVSFAGFGGSWFVGSKSREKKTNLVSADAACH